MMTQKESLHDASHVERQCLEQHQRARESERESGGERASARYLEKHFQLLFIVHDVFPDRGSGSTFLQLLLTDVTNLTNSPRGPFRPPFSVAAFFFPKV
jgi:hypothetical protein